jgi:hypothetical protein
MLRILTSLYNDKIYHESIAPDLFTKAVIRRNWNTLDIPVLSYPYIVEVYGYNAASDSISRDFYHSKDTAVSIRYDTTDYIVISIFEEKTNKRITGYIAFDNTKPNILVYDQYLFPIEVSVE